ncbi:MAG: spermidine synthase [Actinomycetota bacterium]|nr:spermidine synthase [Actinomycetota bacterium]
MSARFEEIDRQPTPMGEISLRRRIEPSLHVDVYEVKLGDEFLMSSLFTVTEIALAVLSLTELAAEFPDTGLDITVGGLGLGFTANAVLEDPLVRSLHVVDALGEVIDWHSRLLLPLSAALTSDPRCDLVHGDFFEMVATGAGFGAHTPDRYHGVFVDIDHTPHHHLHPSHASFYTREGLTRLAAFLHPGGVFGLWSDDPPDVDFVHVVEEVFASCEAHTVTFPNFYTEGESSSTVYVARLART